MEYLFNLSKDELEAISKTNIGHTANYSNATQTDESNVIPKDSNASDKISASKFEKYRDSVSKSIADVSAFYTDKDGNNLDSLKNEIYNAKTWNELDRLSAMCEKFRMDFYRDSMQ